MDAQRMVENARRVAMDEMKEVKDKLEEEMQKKLEQQVQSIKIEMTDQVLTIKSEILQQINLLISQLQMRFPRPATSTINDWPSTSSQMLNESSLIDCQEMEQIIKHQIFDNISLNQICKMVKVNVPYCSWKNKGTTSNK
ncbi:Uncharacterized protein TCM_044789 [Theobroma cacao]|uniref:Uncharacterized protein n=1 Tax=Theobroma cacao TaxID=3641 RepID=A0A061FSP6_THECC|nr:Uncharacterized protein TCM_044789 [Theobroma cacao]